MRQKREEVLVKKRKLYISVHHAPFLLLYGCHGYWSRESYDLCIVNLHFNVAVANWRATYLFDSQYFHRDNRVESLL